MNQLDLTKNNSNGVEEEKMSEKFLQSTLYSEFGNFFISTCYRRCSALLNSDSWYYETFAWKLNNDNERTDWVADNSGASITSQAIKQHIEVCEQLLKNGEFNFN